MLFADASAPQRFTLLRTQPMVLQNGNAMIADPRGLEGRVLRAVTLAGGDVLLRRLPLTASSQHA